MQVHSVSSLQRLDDLILFEAFVPGNRHQVQRGFSVRILHGSELIVFKYIVRVAILECRKRPAMFWVLRMAVAFPI